MNNVNKSGTKHAGIIAGGFILLMAATAVNLPTTSLALDPTATAVVSDVTAAGATSYSFIVKYRDDGPVETDGIDDDDIRVSGPGGFDVPAKFVTISTGPDATYSIVPPGGSWDSSDNGTYEVVMQPNQVFDQAGNPVKAGNLSSFHVQISGPAASPAQPLNLSTRMRVQTGDNVMIGGFIITGNGPKAVIIRAIGPSLTNSGVPGALADPIVTLHGDSSTIASNDNWKDSQQSQIETTGLQPSDDHESAIVTSLSPGAYTAIVEGKDQGTGVGLVELYDLDSGAASSLANISTRGVVETGDNVMIGGFILGKGTGQSRVVLRAIGPTLSAAGVNGALQDPMLELHDGNGALVRSNNDWKDTQQTEIQATNLAPNNDAESAIVVTISPGAYTAIVRGSGGTTGVALVEVYSLQ